MLGLPQDCNISHEGFKFPPMTPKPNRTPGWKLGSGFEGIKIDYTAISKFRKLNGTIVKRTRKQRFQTPYSRALELSNIFTPSLHVKKSQEVMENRAPNKSSILPQKIVQLRGFGSETAVSNIEAAFDQTYDVSASPGQPTENRTSKSPQCPTIKSHVAALGRDDVFDSRTNSTSASQSIRKPSRSERHGWLRCRRADDVDMEDNRGTWPVEDSAQPNFLNPPAIWNNEQQVHAQSSGDTENIDVPSAQLQTAVPQKLLEIQDSQDLSKYLKAVLIDFSQVFC